MEIKVGEYVRTKSGDIGIFNKYFEDKAWFEMKKNDDDFYGIQVSAIVKHSFNIIDLIESIDILVFKIKGCDFISRGIVYEEYDASKGEFYYIVNGHRLEEIQIIKILTHEQYERDCFVVEEEE